MSILKKNEEMKFSFFFKVDLKQKEINTDSNVTYHKISIKLNYKIDMLMETFMIEEKIEIPCCLPFTHSIKMIPIPMAPLAIDNENSLDSYRSYFVNLKIDCCTQNIKGINLFSITVKSYPFMKLIENFHSDGDSKEINILPNVQFLYSDQSLTLGFDVLISSKVENILSLPFISINWANKLPRKTLTTTIINFPINIEKKSPFKVTVNTNSDTIKIVGMLFFMNVDIHNISSRIQEFFLEIQDSSDFFTVGPKFFTGFLEPYDHNFQSFQLLSICSGYVFLPELIITSNSTSQKITKQNIFIQSN